MAVIFNNLPATVFAYTNNLKLVATDSEMTTEGLYEYEIELKTHDGIGTSQTTQTINFKQRPDPELKGNLDLSPIITNYLKSNVVLKSDYWLIPRFTIKVNGGYYPNGEGYPNHDYNDIYLLNGVDLLDRNQRAPDGNASLGDYILSRKFLTYLINERFVSKTSRLFLQVLITGRGNPSPPTGCLVNVMRTNGYTSQIVIPYEGNEIIQSIEVSPSKMAGEIGIPIDEILYIRAGTLTSSTVPITYRLKDDPRFTPINFSYVNSFGATDTISFTKAKEENIKINKEVLSSGYSRRYFNTEVAQTIEVYSDWMTEQESINMRDFWHSPHIVAYSSYDEAPREVILKNSSVDIKTRRNEKLIQYKVSFEYADVFQTARQ